MDKATSLSLSGLILGTIYLSRHVGTTFAFDKPVHSSIVVLAACAVLLLGYSRIVPHDGTRTSRGQQYEAVPLSDVGQPHASREPSPTREDVGYPSSLRKLRTCFFILVCAVCARLAITRYTIVNIQCTALSWEPFIPLVLAVLEHWTISGQKGESILKRSNGSIHEHTLDERGERSSYRIMYAVATLGLGSLIALHAASGQASTFICASTLSNHSLVPLAQRLGTILDVMMLYCASTLLEGSGGLGTRGSALRVGSVGWALLIASVATLAYGVLYTTFLATPIARKRVFEIPPYYVSSLTKLTAIACLTLISACIATLHVGLTTVTSIAIFAYVCTTATTHAWHSSSAFPPASTGLGFVGVCILIAGFVSYLYFDATASHTSRHPKKLFVDRLSIWLWLTMTTLLLIHGGLLASSSTSVSYHPIDLLMYDAQRAHDAYLNHTSASKSLAQAAKTYRERYGRHPPPGFEHWYKYATERDSLVIDAFDSIHHDLQPFWALSPQQIRERTWQMMSNPWHDASGLSIRDGKVEVSPSKFTLPTHAWMLEGLVKMIGNFAEWLPDMDLAFNVNDECRIAVPFEVIEEMRKQADGTASLESRVQNSFSADRAEGWTPLPDEPKSDRIMRELSWQKTFNAFGNIGCPPKAPARTQRNVNPGKLCTTCTAPHSLGAFLANWSLANDLCHQPDLAHLHGIYLAPAAFKASHDLYPIFSQSKVPGFNDILYPSAWNYIDKAQYAPTPEYPDPAFPHKNASLFWRGATSEGFSSGNGQWKGMARQRFVQLANGLNGTSSTAYPLLLPHATAAGEDKLAYANLPLLQLTSLLATDIRIVSSIARCGGRDCPDQAAEFAPLVGPTDFQTHWGYKYLLDLDGAGFSGRFLPFLQSNSLPFKAAIFREWWDDRVTAWMHFVPLDIRGHGMWATLAYFAGINSEKLETGKGGGNVVAPAHEKEGQRIAEQGRDWAGKVLRKEDMEIYFFRLLLEWGRLTDERREGIGFAEDLG